MKHLLAIFLALCATASAQTIRTLGFNSTNGAVVANTGTNVLTFANVTFNTITTDNNATIGGDLDVVNAITVGGNGIYFYSGSDSVTRANLGFSTNLNTFWTATNASNARSAVELGATNTPTFRRLVVDPNASGALGVQYGANDSGIYNGATYNQLSLRVGGVNALTAQTNGVTFADPATTRTNLGLGATWLTNTNSTNFRLAIGIGLAALTNTSNAAAMRQLAGSTNSSHPFSGTFEFTNPDNNLTYFAVVSNGIILDIYEY